MEIIKLEKSRNKVVFDVTAEDFKVALDKAFEVKNAKVSIKGFRAGKAPRHVYEKNFGVESLYEEETIEGEKVRAIIKEFEEANGLPTRLIDPEDENSDIKKAKENQIDG